MAARRKPARAPGDAHRGAFKGVDRCSLSVFTRSLAAFMQLRLSKRSGLLFASEASLLAATGAMV